MSTDKRVTNFGFTEIQLLNGKTCKVRSLTFKEKKDYLEFVGNLSISESSVISDYLKIQVDVAYYLLSLWNPEISRQDVEEGVSGEILKKILDIAFYDPFNLLSVQGK